MKKKFLILLLAAALLTVSFASCNSQTNETESGGETLEVIESELGPENTLTSLGEKITLNVTDSKLYITYLGTATSGENMAAKNSEYALPQYGTVNGENIELNW